MNDEIKEILDKPKILMLSYGIYISLNDYVKLKDYITNLQEQLQITQEKWDKDKQWVECRTKEWLDYKSRIEKAVDYIKCGLTGDLENDRAYVDEKCLLDILNGRSDE